MSVIVAIKENGVVYMGADSQTTAGKTKVNGLNETAFKIVRLENGMLVGFCGKVADKHTILAMDDVFTLDAEGTLTKKHIVTSIVPKLLGNLQQIGDKKKGTMNVSIMLAYKDKLYQISGGFSVLSLNSYARTGSGAEFTTWYLYEETQLPVRKRILGALVESAKYTDTVGGPYVLIDTRDLEFEIVDMGGENH